MLPWKMQSTVARSVSMCPGELRSTSTLLRAAWMPMRYFLPRTSKADRCKRFSNLSPFFLTFGTIPINSFPKRTASRKCARKPGSMPVLRFKKRQFCPMISCLRYPVTSSKPSEQPISGQSSRLGSASVIDQGMLLIAANEACSTLFGSISLAPFTATPTSTILRALTATGSSHSLSAQSVTERDCGCPCRAGPGSVKAQSECTSLPSEPDSGSGTASKNVFRTVR
mmetsp:Transcript_122350/g.191094  ORF Transcript_122350/g.191094 Transcript_122350/m.191094 type:complete len:226 (-) Transcript_122350:106-783(-)